MSMLVLHISLVSASAFLALNVYDLNSLDSLKCSYDIPVSRTIANLLDFVVYFLGWIAQMDGLFSHS